MLPPISTIISEIREWMCTTLVFTITFATLFGTIGAIGGAIGGAIFGRFLVWPMRRYEARYLGRSLVEFWCCILRSQPRSVTGAPKEGEAADVVRGKQPSSSN